MKVTTHYVVVLMLSVGLFVQPLQGAQQQWPQHERVQQHDWQELLNVTIKAISALVVAVPVAGILVKIPEVATDKIPDWLQVAVAAVGWAGSTAVVNYLIRAGLDKLGKSFTYRVPVSSDKDLHKVNVAQEIENKINGIINITYELKDSPAYKVFPTLRSQIFLLQNIQDFFEFKQGKEFAHFNLLMFQACTKKINELERQLMIEKDAEGNITFVDHNLVARAIDNARDFYMAKLGMFAETLRTISGLKVDKKDAALSKKIRDVWDFIIQVFDGVREKNISGFDGNVNTIALYSILGYLYCMRDVEKNRIAETQNVTAEDIAPQPAIEEITTGPTMYTIPEKQPNLTGLRLMSLAAAMRAQGKNPEEKQYTQEAFEQKQRAYQFPAEQATEATEKQSIFTRIRSAWNSWWYGK